VLPARHDGDAADDALVEPSVKNMKFQIVP
jgi:hypothetical protein